MDGWRKREGKREVNSGTEMDRQKGDRERETERNRGRDREMDRQRGQRERELESERVIETDRVTVSD